MMMLSSADDEVKLSSKGVNKRAICLATLCLIHKETLNSKNNITNRKKLGIRQYKRNMVTYM